RNPAAHLRARRTANSRAEPRSGLSRLPADRQRLARAGLVPRWPSAADRHRMVAQLPSAIRRSTSHQGWTSCMKTNTRTMTTAIAALGLTALLAYADPAHSVNLDFLDESVRAEPDLF